mmetsp:Transcript_14006/g.34651  ORF Transcript_14006/g.34651 Transcript_14006/m.34651 type:complete len:1317 (+) Transcript_14006:141-4091(+)|eukprot:CAMPEP_0179000676 /NCGR_PEP_ID=MMETSP0795-20121207/10834_1 /TAXON_ID=88552 /ORGANISM="Amoebophrya sp., Strain Ameob2" /LENGTH=1316 /DNA_ID=CAMNT_0020693759 /DNA_START=100 /DNA_END=4050 /DNA_ORIENTATION=-
MTATARPPSADHSSSIDQNAALLKAVQAFVEHKDLAKLQDQVALKAWDGRLIVKNVLAAFENRHVIVEAVDQFTGERKWIRFAWVHPVDPDFTTREFYLLKNIPDVSCFPKIEHLAVHGSLVVAVYTALAPGSRTLAKELDGPPGTRTGKSQPTISVFRMSQIVNAILEAVAELDFYDLTLLDLRTENIWLSRTNYSEDLEGNMQQAKSRSFTHEEPALDPAHPQRRLGMNQYREKLKVTFLELENLQIAKPSGPGGAAALSGAAGGSSSSSSSPPKKAGSSTRKNARKSLMNLPAGFFSKVPIFAKQFGLPEVMDRTMTRWGDVQLYKIREIGGFLLPEVVRAMAKKRAPQMFSDALLRNLKGDGKDRSPGGREALGAGDDGDGSFPRDKLTLARAQRWAVAKLFIKLLECVDATQAPVPRTLVSGAALGAEEGTTSTGESNPEMTFSSPTRKCVKAPAYLVSELPSTSAEEGSGMNSPRSKGKSAEGGPEDEVGSPIHTAHDPVDLFLVSPQKPSNSEDINAVYNKNSGGDSKLPADVITRIESVGFAVEEIAFRLEELERTTNPEEDVESQRIVFANGIGMMRTYVNFYKWWEKWVSFGLPEDGVTMKGLRFALSGALVTRSAFAAESDFGVLEAVVPLLLQKKSEKISFPDLHAEFSKRVDLSVVEDKFFSMPRLGGGIWDLTDVRISSGHVWRLIEMFQVAVERKAKIKLSDFALAVGRRAVEIKGVGGTTAAGASNSQGLVTAGAGASNSEQDENSSGDDDSNTVAIPPGSPGARGEDEPVFEFPKSPTKSQGSGLAAVRSMANEPREPTLGEVERQILTRYINKNSRSQKFMLMKLKSIKHGPSDRGNHADGTPIIIPDMPPPIGGAPGSPSQTTQGQPGSATPTSAAGAAPTNRSSSPSKPATPSVAGSAAVSQKSVANKSSSSSGPKEEVRIFAELSGFDATSSAAANPNSRKEKMKKAWNLEYIFLPRSDKTVVEWEDDAIVANTCFLYLALCEYLVICGKLVNPVGSIDRFVTELPAGAPQLPSRLKYLSLRNTKCFDNGALKILLSSAAKKLEFLDLSGNCLTNKALAELSNACGSQLNNALPALRCLLLQSNTFTASGVQSIAGMLDNEHPLEVLDLADNCCSGCGSYFARLFQKLLRSSLHTISLRRNGLISSDVPDLVTALREKANAATNAAKATSKRPVLEFLTLNLEDNQIGEAGIQDLFRNVECGRLNLRNTGPSSTFMERFVKDERLSDAVVVRTCSLEEPWQHEVLEPRTKLSYLDRLGGDPAGSPEDGMTQYLEAWVEKPSGGGYGAAETRFLGS